MAEFQAMRRDFVAMVQTRTARVAIGASTLRKQGAPGAVAAARAFLQDMDLKPFGTSSATKFALALDRDTARLQRALPRGARGWGTARKALNIFLRDALYCSYLNDRYRLERAETLFEVPLDSITSRCIRSRASSLGLPRWPGVARLTPVVSALYQAGANAIAADARLPRVHLDGYWWGQRTDA